MHCESSLVKLLGQDKREDMASGERGESRAGKVEAGGSKLWDLDLDQLQG